MWYSFLHISSTMIKSSNAKKTVVQTNVLKRAYLFKIICSQSLNNLLTCVQDIDGLLKCIFLYE